MNKHIILYLWCMILFQQCTSPTKSLEDEEAHLHGIMDKVNHLDKDSIVYEVSSLDHIGNMPLVEVEWPAGSNFLVPERTSQIELFSCLNCHDRSIESLKSSELSKYKKSHWNISIHHAPSETMNCLSCHNDQNLNELVSLTKEPISFNKSYNLCGQCHSQQKKDWLGGAHGKRVGGWAPPRVSMTCVNCHNPHDPSFKPRWPSRLNKTKIIQQENE